MKKVIKKLKKTDVRLRLKRVNAHAFSNLELILVIALVTIIGLTSVPFLSRFLVQSATIDTYNRLLAQLRKAQIYAIDGKQNGPWGVYYGTVAGTKKIILYQGTSYASHNAAFDESYTVSPNVTVTGLSDINFSQVSGTPNTAATITITGTSNTTRNIQINAQGIVNYAPAGPTYTPAPTPTNGPPTPTPTYTPPSGPPVLDAAGAPPRSSCSVACSWSQTIGNNANRILIVGVGSASVPTSVTYGGSSLTLITSVAAADEPSLWYLVNPPVGTNNVTINGGLVTAAGSISFSNVNQLTPIGNYATGSTSSTSISVTVSGTTTNQTVVDVVFHLVKTITPGFGQTEAWLSGTSFTDVAGSYKSASAGSTNMSWSGTTGAWYEAAAAIN